MSDMKRGLLKGALILTAAGFLSRIIGFFYRIFLSHAIGAEQIGIFQLASPLYALCFSLCAVGIHSILSRTISARFAEKKERAAFDSLVTGVILTLLLSLASAFFLFRFAGPISGALLGEPRCAPLLQLLSASLPFACVHSCISAYFYARKRTGIPSFSQLLEQCVRVGASVLFYSVCMEQGSSPSAALAAGGALAGELASCLFSMIAVSLEFTRHGYHLHIPSHPLSQAGSILLPSLPLTANHVLVTILHSTESILIPGRLEASGMSASAALSIYGVLTGMAIPMVLFPSAITNSVAVMLLPSVAEDQATGRWQRISRTIESTIHYCLMLGIFFTGVFVCFGNSIGILLFHNKDAGPFLQTLAFLCPFLYLNGTLTSILNGLGKTMLSFLENLVCLGLRILFVFLLVPSRGIPGYLWGLLVSELAASCLNIIFLRRIVPFAFHAAAWILKPACALLASLGCGFFLEHFLTSRNTPELLRLFFTLAFSCLIYLLFFPDEWRKYLKRQA